MLDAYLSEKLDELRDITEDWILTYNYHRPYDASGRIPPSLYSERVISPGIPLTDCQPEGDGYDTALSARFQRP